MKGIAIGLSNNSKEILKRLKKTEFVKDIYIAGSSKEDEKENELIQVQKPREILLKKWPEIDLIIFIGSIAASIRIINSFLSPSSFEEPAIYISFTNSVFLSLFKISFELLDRPIAIPFKSETIDSYVEIISCRWI